MTDNSALDILKNAILLEKRGKAFYRTAADQATNDYVKDFFQTMAFWVIFVLVQSAEFRSRGKTGGLERPMRLLRRVIRCGDAWEMLQCFNEI